MMRSERCAVNQALVGSGLATRTTPKSALPLTDNKHLSLREVNPPIGVPLPVVCTVLPPRVTANANLTGHDQRSTTGHPHFG